MSLVSKVKKAYGKFNKKVEDAKINTENQLWWNNYARLISPDKLEVFEDYLKIDGMLVECVIVGLPQLSTDGYPGNLKPDFIEKLMNASLKGAVIRVSFRLIPIPTHEAQIMMQEALFRNMVNQKQSQKDNPNGMNNIIQQLDARDMAAAIERLHNNEENLFHSAFIITIFAEDEKAMRQAKSHIKVVMNSRHVLGSYPSRKMLETFIAGAGFPKSEEFTFVEMTSSLAGLLCPTRNPNSSLSNGGRGLYMGDDRKTGKEIMVDLEALAAKHLLMAGGSGTGKTFAILLLLGRLYATGRKVIYTTVKPDEGTRYLDMASYFAPDSEIINIGPGLRNINPLQFLHTGEGLTPLEAAAIYDYQKLLYINHLKVWFDGTLSPNMESYLDKSLNEVYRRAKIERDNPETWKNPFPISEHLIQVWEDSKDSKEDGESALALIRKTYALREGGALSYMNAPTNIDLSKGFTVIDLVKVPEVIRPAMNVLVNGMLATYFKTGNDKGVTIAIDEGGAFLRQKQLSDMVLNIITQGRSYDIQLIFATQQFADLEKAKMSEEFMSNVPIKVVLSSNIDKKAVSYVKDFLMLDDTAVKDLRSAQKGEGIVKIGDLHAPIAFVHSDEEYKIIKGLYTGNNQEIPLENQQQEPKEKEAKIRDEYVQLAKENKIVFSDWLEGEDPAYFLQMAGYQLYQPQNLFSRGFVNCWIHKDEVREDQYVLNQSIDHYASVMQLAGNLIKRGKDPEVHHRDDVDVSLGNEIGFEIEHADSHNLQEIIDKKQRGILKYKKILFIGSKANEAVLIEGAGKDFVVRRGKQLEKWLDDNLNEGFTSEPFDLSENGLKNSEEMANGAF